MLNSTCTQPHHGGRERRGAHPLAAAVQVDPFESKGLKPGYHVSGARVETRRVQAVGQLDSSGTVPHLALEGLLVDAARDDERRHTREARRLAREHHLDVAVHVEFESKL
jgi:hypothetical protein